jgi:hypothetical protein
MSTFPPSEKFIKQMKNTWLFKGFLLTKLPLAAFAGLQVEELSAEQCAVSLPYGWRSQNPFQSIYFAAQSMAAELSTGALLMLAIESSGESVSMLVTKMDASFGKKANAKTLFTCEDGEKIFEAIQQTITTGESVAISTVSVGRMQDGTEVSRFTFEWSCKKRSKK